MPTRLHTAPPIRLRAAFNTARRSPLTGSEHRNPCVVFSLTKVPHKSSIKVRFDNSIRVHLENLRSNRVLGSGPVDPAT